MKNKLTCLKCGWKWEPREGSTPAACPRCKRYDWNIPRKETKKESGK